MRPSSARARLAALALFAAAGALAPAPAQATVTITPQLPWVLSNNTAYYAVNTGAPLMDVNGSFRSYDFTKTAATDAAPYQNAIKLDILSDKVFTLTGSQRLVVVVKTDLVSGTNDAIRVPIGIASLTGADALCVLNDNCQGEVVAGRPFAAHYTQQTTLRIGFFPQDICAAVPAQDGSVQAKGCTGGVFQAPTPGVSATIFKLTFFVTTAADSVAMPTDLGSESASVILSVQQGSPSITCPTGTDLGNVYFPSDSAIILSDSLFTAGVPAGNAPVNTFIAVAKDGGTPGNLTGDFSSGNDFVTRLLFPAGPQTLGGFTNTTDGSDHAYGVAFSVRDMAGVVAPFSAPAACFINGVQSSGIQGFLRKSNCFIATAAFRSIDAAPVAMLREFRDRVLLETAAGRLFVRWYYGWSPGAAEWLMRHPLFRLPVLLALIPVQCLAWLALSPFLAALLTLAGAAILVFGRRAGRSPG